MSLFDFREREEHWCEINIDQLLPVGTPPGDGTHNLDVPWLGVQHTTIF